MATSVYDRLFVDWTVMMARLECPVTSNVLPCHAVCPICRKGDMTIRADYSLCGHWFTCDGCGHTGSAIETAAAAWDMDLTATIRRLASYGAMMDAIPTDKDVTDYEHAYIAKRARFLDFFEKSKETLANDNSTTLRSLQRKLGIYTGFDARRWLDGPGRFVGASDRVSIERLYMPMVEVVGKSSKTIFMGGSTWTDIMLIPYYDMPGRISGFAFYGREGKLDTDYLFRGLSWRIGNRRNAGLGMLSSALNRGPNSGDLIVLPDPLLALQRHVWHFQDHSEPLPLVSTWDSDSWGTAAHTWDVFGGRIVFWGPKSMRPRTLRHARRANGLVSISPWQENQANLTSKQWLKLASNAVSWEDALERTLAESKTSEGDSLILRLNLDDEALRKFLEKCDQDTRARYMPKYPPRKTINYDATLITETEDGWYIDKQLITDAPFRIDQIIHDYATDSIHYSGVIKFRGQDIQFSCNADDMEGKIAPWLRKTLIKAGAGYPVISSTHKDDLCHYSTRFHVPTINRAVTMSGWDSVRQCFVMPGYLIKCGGVLENYSVTKNTLEGAGSAYPEGLTAEEIMALCSNTSAYRVLWAMAAFVASNLIAPTTNATTKGLAVVNTSASNIMATARMLGCPAIKHFKHDASNSWPVVAQQRHMHMAKDYLRWLTADKPVNVITDVRWFAAQSLKCREGWHVATEMPDVDTKPLVSVACKLLPNFLLWLSRKNFELPAGDLCDAVINSMADWFAAVGGNHEAVLSSAAVFDWDRETDRVKRCVDGFRMILCCGYYYGEIKLVRQGFEPSTNCDKAERMVILEKNDQLFVPKTAVNIPLLQRQAPLPHQRLLTQSLKAAKLLLREMRYDTCPGWAIRESTWAEWAADWQARWVEDVTAAEKETEEDDKRTTADTQPELVFDN